MTDAVAVADHVSSPAFSASLPTARDVVVQLNAAYEKVGDSRTENFVLGLAIMEKLGQRIQAFWDERGFRAPAAFYDHFYRRVTPLTLPDDRQAYIAFMAACVTDYGPRLFRHIQERLAEDANFFGQLMGWTGSGKSSCAVHILDSIRQIAVEQFRDHIARSLEEVPAKLKGKQPGQGIVLDEELELTGEGSVTDRKTFTNIENTLRASGICMLICSPQAKDHNTSQFVLEAVLWNREKKRTLFHVWVLGEPMGYVIIPWMRADLFAVYTPFKAESVDLTLNAIFRKENALFDMMQHVFEHEGFTTVLLTYSRLNKTQLKAMLAAFFGHKPWVKSLRDQLGDFVYDQLTIYPKLGPKYAEIWGAAPHANFAKLAKKFTEE